MTPPTGSGDWRDLISIHPVPDCLCHTVIFPVATVANQALIMSKGPVVIGSTQQFDALLKSSRIVVADCE